MVYGVVGDLMAVVRKVVEQVPKVEVEVVIILPPLMEVHSAMEWTLRTDPVITIHVVSISIYIRETQNKITVPDKATPS